MRKKAERAWIRTMNLLLRRQTRYRCATRPLHVCDWFRQDYKVNQKRGASHLHHCSRSSCSNNNKSFNIFITS